MTFCPISYDDDEGRRPRSTPRTNGPTGADVADPSVLLRADGWPLTLRVLVRPVETFPVSSSAWTP
jgi:hypothetical protein